MHKVLHGSIGRDFSRAPFARISPLKSCEDISSGRRLIQRMKSVCMITSGLGVQLLLLCKAGVVCHIISIREV